MLKKIYAAVFGLIFISFPSLSFAAVDPVLTDFNSRPTLSTLIDYLIYYGNRILVLMMGIAVIMFVWYVIQYFIKPDADRTEGSKYVMYSLIGFFVVLSFWGLVNILQNTFGLSNDRNRPGSWSSFESIFPTSGGSGGSNNANSRRTWETGSSR